MSFRDMPTAPDYRDYINPHPRASNEAQLAYFGAQPGAQYIEDRSGKVFERKLLPSLRRGSIVRVVMAFLLAPTQGRTQTRRDRWAERDEKIRAKGAKLVVMRAPQLSGNKLAMVAYEEIANSGRGAPGKAKTGRPRLVKDPAVRERLRLIWRDRKHKTREAARRAVCAALGFDVNRTWCYNNLGAPDGD